MIDLGPPAFGYVRVSTEDQAQSGLGLQAQKDLVLTYAELKGLDLKRIYEDAGVSASTPLAERPAGSNLVDDALRHPDRTNLGIIVPKLDRAWRSVLDCVSTLQLFDAKGIALHLIDLGGNSVDTRSPSGRFMLTVLAAAAEMERGLIRKRTSDALRARQRAGKHVGGVPFGWEYDRASESLSERPDQQQVLREILRLSRAGRSSGQIATLLNKRQTPGPTPRSHGWSRRTVSKILARHRNKDT